MSRPIPTGIERRASSLRDDASAGGDATQPAGWAADFRALRADRGLPWAAGVVAVSVALVVGLVAAVHWCSRCRQWNAPPLLTAVSDIRRTVDYRQPLPPSKSDSALPGTEWNDPPGMTPPTGHITGMALSDASNVAVITQTGIHHGRLDGAPLLDWQAVFWNTWCTDGQAVLPEDRWREVSCDGRRLWFVSRRGGLVSCDRHFHDWRRHAGVEGFVENCDLAAEVSVVKVVENFAGRSDPLLIVGTGHFAIGLYDAQNRDWLRITPGGANSPAADIAALMWRDGFLWAGTKQGLYLYRINDVRGRLAAESLASYALEAEYAASEVRAVRWAGEGRRGTVHCVLAGGAHLASAFDTHSAPPRNPRWDVVVDGGDPALADVDMPADALLGLAEDCLEAPGHFWLVLPDIGLARYDPAGRRLELHNEGLAGERCEALAVHGVRSARGSGTNWAIVQSSGGEKAGLYVRRPSADGKTWQWSRITPEEKQACEVAFWGENPVVRCADGEVLLYRAAGGSQSGLLGKIAEAVGAGDAGEAPAAGLWPLQTTLFSPNPCPEPSGPAVVAGDRLYVAAGGAFPSTSPAAAMYDRRVRGWTGMPADNKVRLDEFALLGDRLYANKVNGEFGWYDLGQSPIPYHAHYGPSEMPRSAGTVTTADWSLQNGRADRFFFVRAQAISPGSGDQSLLAVYRYDARTRAIARQGAPLADIVPWQLRQTGDHLVIWGQEVQRKEDPGKDAPGKSDPGSAAGKGVVQILRDDRWQAADHQDADIRELAASGAAAVFRARDGSLFAHLDGGKAWPLGRKSDAPAAWKRLAADRAGRVWGLEDDAGATRLFSYHRPSATWREHRFPVASPSRSTFWNAADDKSTSDVKVIHDFLVLPEEDLVLVGTSQSLEVLDAATEAECEDPVEGAPDGSVKRLISDGSAVFARAVNGQRQAIWRRDAQEKKWARLLATELNGPPVGGWTSAAWAGFIGREMWLLTNDGVLWQYQLDARFWQETPIIHEGPGIRRVVHLPDSQTLWVLGTAGRLVSVRYTLPDEPESLATLSVKAFAGSRDYKLDELRAAESEWRSTGDGFWSSFLAIWGGLAFLFFVVAQVASERIPWIADREGFYQWVTGWGLLLLAVALVSGAAALVVIACGNAFCQWRADRIARTIQALRPFEQRDFTGAVADFLADDDLLRVRSDSDLYEFRCQEEDHEPLRYVAQGGQFPAPSAKFQQEDATGDWTMALGNGRLTLARRGSADRQHVPLHPIAGGLAEDQWNDLAVAGRILVVLTPSGVLEFDLDDHCALRRIAPLASFGGERLVTAGDSVYLQPPGKQALGYDAEAPWRQVAPLRTVRVSAHGVSWVDDRARGQCTLQGFDAASHRFLSDIFLPAAPQGKALCVTADGSVFARSQAGWRRVSEQQQGFALSEPSAAAPSPATTGRSIQVADFWKCVREESTTGKDTVTLFFTGTTPAVVDPDPFASGRWPDEDVQSILAAGDEVLLATRYGVKFFRPPAETIRHTLHRTPAMALALHEGAVFCQTPDGVYRLTGRAWQHRADDPFPTPPPQALALPLGDDRVQALTSRLPDQWTTELLDYDRSQNRFRRDVVRRITGDSRGLWAENEAYLERIALEGFLVRGHRRFDHAPSYRHLRLGRDGRLHARSGDAAYVYDSTGAWTRVQWTASPFGTPVAGALSPRVHWRRIFAEEGDHIVLSSSGDSRKPLKIRSGKLSCDYVDDVAGRGDAWWEKTDCGVVASEPPRVVGWPDPADNAPARQIAVDEGQLVCMQTSPGDPLFWRFQDNDHWKQLQEPPSPFLGRQAVFDRHRWTVEALLGRDGYALRSPAAAPERLNAYGKFAFDTIRSVVVHGGLRYEACGDGLATRPQDASARYHFFAWPAGSGPARLAVDGGQVWGLDDAGQLMQFVWAGEADSTRLVGEIVARDDLPSRFWSSAEWRAFLATGQPPAAALIAGEALAALADREIVDVQTDGHLVWVLAHDGLHVTAAIDGNSPAAQPE